MSYNISLHIKYIEIMLIYLTMNNCLFIIIEITIITFSTIVRIINLGKLKVKFELIGKKHLSANEINVIKYIKKIKL